MNKWWEHAACKHLTDLFQLRGVSEHRYNRSETVRQRAEHALTICRSCPVLEHCRKETLESGYHEMIAGGLLPWQQGKQRPYNIAITKRASRNGPKQRPQCGSHTGFNTHRNHKEEPCRSCIQAERLYNSEYKRQWRAKQTA